MNEKIAKINDKLEESSEYIIKFITDIDIGLTTDQLQNKYLENNKIPTWYKSKKRKQFLESMGSSKFNIGVLTYYRGGSFPVWISCFKIPFNDINNASNTRETENMTRLIAPKHYMVKMIKGMINLIKEATGKGNSISSSIVEAMLEKVDGSSSGNFNETNDIKETKN